MAHDLKAAEPMWYMSSMARHTDRKLFLFGRYSLALLLPKLWLKELGIQAGSLVHLEFDRSRARIVVRLRPAPTKELPQTKKRKTPPKPDTGWEPLPEL